MTRRRVALIGLAIVLALLAVSWWLERRQTPTVEQAVAHERTAVATAASAKADTVFATDTLRLPALRQDFRTRRDTLRLTDTLLVKAALAAADTVIRADSTAIADASRAIIAHTVTEAALRGELAIALKPHPVPRLSAQVAALYEPVGMRPTASVTAGLRVIGRWSLVARADQPLVAGASPRGYVGLSLSLAR